MAKLLEVVDYNQSEIDALKKREIDLAVQLQIQKHVIMELQLCLFFIIIDINSTQMFQKNMSTYENSKIISNTI